MTIAIEGSKGIGPAGTSAMPAFSATLGTSQSSLSASVWTKLKLDSEDFDTANCFDSTTNYRFTPTVAGYYIITGNCTIGGATNTQTSGISIYKNGTVYRTGSMQSVPSGGSTQANSVSAVVYLNGTTDYVELYAFVSGSGTLSVSGCGMTGALLRTP